MHLQAALQLPALARVAASTPAAVALALRGGSSIGPFRAGPFSISSWVLLSPRGCVFLNAFAGIMYSMSLVGLDPGLKDPTLKYWQTRQTPCTQAILQYFALALVWINAFMLYAMLRLQAPAAELLKFQSFGWFSVLALLLYQSTRFRFTKQQDTLGVMLTLLLLTTYLGFVP